MIELLLAAQLFNAAGSTPGPGPAPDPRPSVKVTFRIRANHPYTLQYGNRVAEFEKVSARKIAAALDAKIRFLRFSSDDGEYTLNFLLDDRDEGVAHEELREIHLFTALNEEVTRANAKTSWMVRAAGTDNRSIGSIEAFATEIASAVSGKAKSAAQVVADCFQSIDLATRARKPAHSAYWLMPFRLDQMYVGDRTIFRVWSPIGNYLAEPVYLAAPLTEATDEYAGKTVTVTKAAEPDLESLRKRGRIDASRVRIDTFFEYTPPRAQPPPGT